jgi:disulfide bond formation protein DsbB
MRALLESQAFCIAIRVYWGGTAVGGLLVAIFGPIPWWVRIASLLLAVLAAAVAFRASHVDAVDSAILPAGAASCEPYDTFAQAEHAVPRVVATQPIGESGSKSGGDRA